MYLRLQQQCDVCVTVLLSTCRLMQKFPNPVTLVHHTQVFYSICLFTASTTNTSFVSALVTNQKHTTDTHRPPPNPHSLTQLSHSGTYRLRSALKQVTQRQTNRKSTPPIHPLNFRPSFQYILHDHHNRPSQLKLSSFG